MKNKRTRWLSVAICGLAGSLQAGVFAHYTFDTDYTDSSGNGRHGTLTDVAPAGNSAIDTGAGNSPFGGGSMFLSSDRDYVAIPSKTFGTGSAYTIAFWARKAPGDTGDPALWDMVIGQRDNDKFFIALNDASGTSNRKGIRWRSNHTAGGVRQVDWTAPNDTAWHHYAITADHSKNLSFYLDGTQVGATLANVETGIILDTIGEAYTTGRDFDFHGHLDEVWIFDEMLSADRVHALYAQNNPDTPPAGLVLHYAFDGDFTDSSGQNNHGAASGAASLTTTAGEFAAGTGGLALDGADVSYVALTSPLVYGSGDAWSACWWAKRGELGGNKAMVLGERGTTDDFIWQNDDFSGLRFRSSNSTSYDFTVPQDLSLHHYALVADGAGHLTLYRDGQFSASLSGDTSFHIDTVGQAYTTSSLHYGFQGSLDEMRVYDTALAAQDVTDIYDAENPGSPNLSVTRLRVFLQGGQSNADGRADPSALPTSPVNLQQPQTDVDLYYRVQGSSGSLTLLRPGLTETSQFGPDITLGRRLTDIFQHGPETRVAIIKYANGGTDLKNHWKAGGDATNTGDGSEYVTFQQTVINGLAALAAAYPAASIAIEGMVWHQGESDVAGGYQADYQAGLTAFIADVRATYGSDLPFVCARLSIYQTALNATGLGVVRAAQQAVADADPRVRWVDTDAMDLKTDNLHLDADGQQDLGIAFAEASAMLRWTLGTFSPADIDAGQAEPGANKDGDPQTNEEEYIAGTDATSATSFLQVQITITPPDDPVIHYPGAVDRLYAVERYKADMGTWEVTQSDAPGNDGTVQRSLPSVDSSPMLRVRASLP